jgi:TerB-C domain
MNIPTSKKGLLTALIEGTTKLRREILDFFERKNRSLNENPKSYTVSRNDSIIDVTNEVYVIPQPAEQKAEQPTISKKPGLSVPFWNHQYVYSYSELKEATKKQREFYVFLKNQFLNEVFVDIERNSNYVFILLFDLLREYEDHKNIIKLEKQLKLLGQFYPVTKRYTISFLIEKMEARGDIEEVARLNEDLRYGYDAQNYWSFGNKYKIKLNLSDDDVKLLNRLYNPNNNFCEIEFCCHEIIKLYLSTIKRLQKSFIEEGTSFKEQILFLTDLIARKQFRYRLNSQNYKYSIESSAGEIYLSIFKYCENAVRETYGHKRKLNADGYFTNSEVKNEFETRIGIKILEIIASELPRVAAPDEATEIELYAQNPTRWKIKFEKLTANFKHNGKQFVDDVLQLGKLNKRNPSVENIFFEGSKFIAPISSESALNLYVYYLHYDMQSATFDNKKLTKTIQKSLFKTSEQLRDFEIIIGEFINDKNLEKALSEIPKIYAVKRKKIQLDTAVIKNVQEQHSGTVGLLNEFLQDEYEDETTTIKTSELNDEELKIEITPKAETVTASIYTDNIAFTPLQLITLEMFSKNNFALSITELETFAKLNAAFKNQLIDSLNEICYDILDDVLIEEEDDYFSISEDYYRKLLAK